MKDINARKDFMDATIKLLNKKPLIQFNVKDIVQAAGYSRQSFYSHFLDKYDIVNQIFMEDIESINSQFSGKRSFFEKEYQKSVFDNYKDKHVMYKNCLLYTGQNSLYDCMRYLGHEMHLKEIKKVYKDSPIPMRVNFELDYHIFSLSSATREFIMNDDSQPSDWMATITLQTLPETLKEVYL